MDLSTFLIVLSGKNKKNEFYFSDKRSIDQHNAAYEKAQKNLQSGFKNTNKILFKLGTNKYADRTQAEIKRMNGLRVPKEAFKNTKTTMVPRFSAPAPASKDWRDTPCAVTAVKDQGLSYYFYIFIFIIMA